MQRIVHRGTAGQARQVSDAGYGAEATHHTLVQADINLLRPSHPLTSSIARCSAINVVELPASRFSSARGQAAHRVADGRATKVWGMQNSIAGC